MAQSVEWRGLTDLQQYFRKLDEAAKREIQKELRKVAAPVAADVRRRASEKGWSQRTVTGIRPGTRLGVAVVRQSRRKTTGAQPQFGGIQLREAFIPAVEQNAALVEREAALAIERLIQRS